MAARARTLTGIENFGQRAFRSGEGPMEPNFDISHLLVLRSLTKKIAEQFAQQARESLTHLAPLFQPHVLLGDLVRSGKGHVKGQDVALQELDKLYQPLARASALNLQSELKPPLDIFASSVDLAPASYSYSPRGSDKAIMVTTPLKWVLSYKDLGPQRLRELISNHPRSSGDDLRLCVLHFLSMHMLAQRRPGVGPIFEALRFPLSSAAQLDLHGLPFVYLSSPISTVRPPDEVILQSTQLSGTFTFEEVVNMDDIARLGDPLREQLLGLVREHGGNLAGELGL
jgi:hypothetical protein